ncbi:uncharacterized protein METZ01_LOCUS512005, partial [marine metagenome]
GCIPPRDHGYPAPTLRRPALEAVADTPSAGQSRPADGGAQYSDSVRITGQDDGRDGSPGRNRNHRLRPHNSPPGTTPVSRRTSPARPHATLRDGFRRAGQAGVSHV